MVLIHSKNRLVAIHSNNTCSISDFQQFCPLPQLQWPLTQTVMLFNFCSMLQVAPQYNSAIVPLIGTIDNYQLDKLLFMVSTHKHNIHLLVLALKECMLLITLPRMTNICPHQWFSVDNILMNDVDIYITRVHAHTHTFIDSMTSLEADTFVYKNDGMQIRELTAPKEQLWETSCSE